MAPQHPAPPYTHTRGGQWGGWSMDCSGKMHDTIDSDSYITDPFPSTVPNYYQSQESSTVGSSQDCEDRTHKDTLFRSCRPPDRPWQTSPPRETLAVEGYASLHFPSPSVSSSALRSLSAFPSTTTQMVVITTARATAETRSCKYWCTDIGRISS